MLVSSGDWNRNYHDLHDKFMGPVDTAAFNKAVYSALKPGGFYALYSDGKQVARGIGNPSESSQVDREVSKIVA